jgi:hypothetical protein
MAHRSIEILIGRLVTDEVFRAAFTNDQAGTLRAFARSGHDLTEVECAAVTSIGRDAWAQMAERIDPRLLKVGRA